MTAIIIIALLVVAYLISSSSSSSGDVPSSTLSAIVQGITQAEGVNPSYNNPGGILQANASGATGQTFGSPPKAIYATLSAGQQDMSNKIESWLSRNPSATVTDLCTWWVNGPNATMAAPYTYCETVASALGLGEDDPINPSLSQTDNLAAANSAAAGTDSTDPTVGYGDAGTDDDTSDDSGEDDD